MADSDSDYVQSGGSGDEAGAHLVRGKKSEKGRESGKKQREKKVERWEEVKRAWDAGLEDDNIESTVAGILEAGKKRRLLKDETALQRGIIRHLVFILDLSSAMLEKDLRPSRHLLSIRYASDFVREFFEQNPISQLSVIGTKDGLARLISPPSGNPISHLEALAKLRLDDPSGSPSLQNALEMARGTLYHTPAHGTREIVVVSGALWSNDPGDIHDTIRGLARDKISVRVIGLAAQVAICRELVKVTNGGSDAGYGVALNEQHFRELLIEATAPPAMRATQTSSNGLLMMGFPSRVSGAMTSAASLCACHGKPTKGGYKCSRCDAKVCQLPVECPGCGLTLVLSTHLARSYHHLFPLKNFLEVDWASAVRGGKGCFSCQSLFPEPPENWRETEGDARGAKTAQGTSISSRYRCPQCKADYCIDCDVFCHESLYNCPSCQAGGALGE